MSAFILTPESLALIALGDNITWDNKFDTIGAKADGVDLLNENINSVCFRYDKLTKYTATEHFVSLTPKEFVAALEAEIDRLVRDPETNVKLPAFWRGVWYEVNSYVYNACEHEEWEGSRGQLVALSASFAAANRLVEVVA